MYSKQYYENKYEGYHLKALKNRPYLREFFLHIISGQNVEG